MMGSRSNFSRLFRTLISTRVGNFISESVIDEAMARVWKINHRGVSFQFAVPNNLNRYRIKTFSTKEPETLEWIDNFPRESVLWDVGANVGLYSIYAAKQRGCRVIAFEPSVFNLELLARNLFLNDLEEQVVIVPLALSDGLGPSRMHLTTTDWGGALSTFGKEIGWDGGQIKDIFQFQTFGLTMDQAVSILNLPTPDYIKMDVDGIEHLILRSAPKTLSAIQGILVEINEKFVEQSELSAEVLKQAGLTCSAKLHSEEIENSTTGFQHVFNQIWSRN